MESPEAIKEIVREKYGAIAVENNGCGCACGCGDSDTAILPGDAYGEVAGYVADADLGLGCGVPTELANIKPGQTVLDLGSGAGLDAFAARADVGDAGRVIGVDMTPEMVERARANAEKLGFDNVSFIQGDIENLPVNTNSVDVILSNCVLNLVPNKQKAFAEMLRVLKPGGHFTVSDIVTEGQLPEPIKKAAELYVGCVSGAMELDAYTNAIANTGFAAVDVLKANPIPIPDDILKEHLTDEEFVAFRESGTQVLSVTVTGAKA